jgi:hypothetical protein
MTISWSVSMTNVLPREREEARDKLCDRTSSPFASGAFAQPSTSSPFATATGAFAEASTSNPIYHPTKYLLPRPRQVDSPPIASFVQRPAIASSERPYRYVVRFFDFFILHTAALRPWHGYTTPGQRGVKPAEEKKSSPFTSTAGSGQSGDDKTGDDKTEDDRSRRWTKQVRRVSSRLYHREPAGSIRQYWSVPCVRVSPLP